MCTPDGDIHVAVLPHIMGHQATGTSGFKKWGPLADEVEFSVKELHRESW